MGGGGGEEKREGGADAGDVGKVLIGANPNVDAAADAALLELRQDVEVRSFVRNKIVGVELAARLRELLDELGERRPGLRRRLRLRRLEFGPNHPRRRDDDTNRCGNR